MSIDDGVTEKAATAKGRLQRLTAGWQIGEQRLSKLFFHPTGRFVLPTLSRTQGSCASGSRTSGLNLRLKLTMKAPPSRELRNTFQMVHDLGRHCGVSLMNHWKCICPTGAATHVLWALRKPRPPNGRGHPMREAMGLCSSFAPRNCPPEFSREHTDTPRSRNGHTQMTAPTQDGPHATNGWLW